MANTTIEKTEICDETLKATENVWKELISRGRNRISKLDRRTQIVSDALREKLDVKTQPQEKSDIEIQLEKSELHLENLIQFGNELVNNIKSANEQQQLLESQANHKKKTELQEKLHNEAELSLRQFDEINRKWSEMNNLKEPMAIYEDMQKQRENISNLMASKDELIAQCQQELKEINKKYNEDQDKQSDDICFLVERIDHQIKLLKNSYKTNIRDLQNSIEREKQKILQAAQVKWNTVYEHLTANEAKTVEMVKEKQTFYAQELDNIRKKQEEITRTTKIRLEKDAELLELEICKTQANILMNSEKIDYNYQVLQKRNEENIIINNQQKRRVAKLNESIVGLKRKLAEIRGNNKQSMEKLSVDIQKLHASINELQTKADHFRKNNMIKLAKVWDINFKEIKHLIKRVFEIDHILYEQQLGQKWIQPNFDWDKLDYIRDSQAYHKNNGLASEKHKIFKPFTKSAQINHKQLHDILHKISDRAGFLLEEKLLQILKPHTDVEQCLVKIENIFSALNITNIAVVENLIKYFEPYSWCPNCSSGVPANVLKSLYSFRSHSNAMESTEGDKIEDQNQIMQSGDTHAVCKNHNLCMEPTLVLTALNEFVCKEIKSTEKSVETRKHINKKVDMALFELDNTHIISYWQQYSSCMSKEQQNIWKSIEHGLNHYLEVLKKRAQIDSECVFLQKQNGELKHLLQQL